MTATTTTTGSDLTAPQAEALRWATELADRGIYPSVDAIVDHGRALGSVPTRTRVERARGALKALGLFPEVSRADVAHSEVQKEAWLSRKARAAAARESSAALEQSPPGPPRFDHPFRRQALEQRRILAELREFKARTLELRARGEWEPEAPARYARPRLGEPAPATTPG